MTRGIAAYAGIALVAASAAAGQTRDENWTKCASNDPEPSIAGCTAIVLSAQETDENLAAAHRNRGNDYSRLKQYGKAIEDYTQYIQLKADDPDGFLNRAGTYADSDQLDEAMAQQAAKVDLTQWPGPLLKFYMGQMTSDQLKAAAADADADTQKAQTCEVEFYGGEIALARGQEPVAVTRLKAARDGCPKTFIEHDGAVAELKRLGIK